MSKISYCSLEEAWGDAYIKDNNDKQENIDKISEFERENIIQNMNNVEREKKFENNNVNEYNAYRINPKNKVENNDPEKEYSPFQESIEKKYLEDKLNFLENEFSKYKFLIDKNDMLNNDKPQNLIENFSNGDKNNFQNNDFIDLILLIIIGLIIILVMNSIFDIGKKIGARNNI